MAAADESHRGERNPAGKPDVREEIEKAFANPPASWLERIETEVERRVSLREKYYIWIAGVFVTMLTLVAWLFIGQTKSSVRQEVTAQLATDQIDDARRKILAARDSTETDMQRIGQMTKEVSSDYNEFTQRIKQINQQDNVILSQDLPKLFVVQQITNITGNKVVLDYDPIPETVRIRMQDAPSPLGTWHKYLWCYVAGRSVVFTNAETVKGLTGMATNHQLAIEYFRASKSK